MPTQLTSVDSRGGWWRILESFAGAWQSNVEVRLENVLTHPTVFACVTLIPSDIGKMRLRLVERDAEGIWEETENPAFSPFLRKPNRYQTIIKFIEQWIFSKLIHGNAYVLKERDGRGVVVAGYILDPQRVRPLVAPDGSVFYELMQDTLATVPDPRVIVPAREIMHDPMYTLYHPLIGIPPLSASGIIATLGNKIIENSTTFFSNGSRPSGLLLAPTVITEKIAAELAEQWQANFTGANSGRVAVLGNNLKYEPMAIGAKDSQLTEQWKDTAEAVASTFHVPWHLVGGPPPPYNNIQALTVQYFTQAIQALSRQLETVLDEGLGLGQAFGNRLGTEFDVNDLLWMDSATLMSVTKDGIVSGVLSPNEGRARHNLPPVDGGDSPMMQQQMFSLEALAERDQADPFAKPAAPPPAAAAETPPADTSAQDAAAEAAAYGVEVEKAFALKQWSLICAES